MVAKSLVQIKLPADPANSLEAGTKQYVDNGLSGRYPKLVATGVKTANYATADGEIVTCDDSGGSFTVTLPAATFGVVVGVRKFVSSANTVTIQRAGSDTIGGAGATSLQLTLLDQVVVLHAVGGLWLPVWEFIGLPALDGRFQAAGSYQPLDSDLTTISGLTPGSGNVLAADGSGWVSKTYANLKTALSLVKGDVGLGNVDNTSDATKNSATATLTNKTLTSPVINSPTGIVKVDVGLGNVDNTSNATERAATRTLTNARITKRVNSSTSTSTLTPDSDSYDAYALTAQAAALSVANPTGSPTDLQQLMIRILDNGTARAITWSGSQWRAVGITLPTTTVVSKVLYVGAVWSSADGKWDVLAVGQQ